MRCYLSSIYGSLLDASTTAALNFVAWNKAYAMYPRPTFLVKEAYLLQDIDAHGPNEELVEERQQDVIQQPQQGFKKKDADKEKKRRKHERKHDKKSKRK
ncbi:hypothetical protein EJ02DRAFT_426611 [Clathrospora elynae]|uniref:Uncharacterized protein n=1 Tax=Clathrospora elynae TaxID=706981 RepID=A0A6A5S9X6_9PLEO|nr:hypothetical protein EJ02DRAFT_426611 [Clathrospora elynae]